MTNQFSRLALLVLAIAFAVYVYFFPPLRPKPIIPIEPEGNKICMDFDTLKPSTLASGLIYNMVQNYQQNQLQAIQTHTSKQVPNDAHAIWFELDTIKKFIYHIEKAVKSNGVSASKIGLRFYYASYPPNSTWTTQYPDLQGFLRDSLTIQYGQKHTLVILPTIKQGDVIYDFNPSDKSTYDKGMPEYDRKMFTKQVFALTTTAKSATVSSTSATDARNHGVLFPPGNTTGEAF